MAELYFKTRADYEEVLQLREQLKQLRKDITEANKAGDTSRVHALGEEYKVLKDRIDELTFSAAKAGGELQALGRKLESSMLKLMGIGAIKKFAQQVFQLRSEFQDAESTMITFLGSAEKGAKFFNELKDYAWYNMFEFKDLQQAATQLIAYGNAQKDLIPIMDKLSNVASGTNRSLMQYIEMWNRAKSIGFVDSRSMQVWAASGVELRSILQEMGEKVNGNRVSFEQLGRAIEHVTGEGGQFFGTMNDKMSNLSASLGQLQDNWNNMLNEIGLSTQGTFKDAIDAAAWLVDNYEMVGKVLLGIIATYGTYKTAMAVTNVVTQIQNKQIQQQIVNLLQLQAQQWGATEAQLAFNKAVSANVYVLAASIIIGIVTALVSFRKKADEAAEAQNALTDAQKESIAKAQQEMIAMQSLFDEAKKAKDMTDERRDAIKKLNKEYGGEGGYLDNLLSEKATVNDIADAYARAAENMRKAHLEEKQNKFLGNKGLDTFEYAGTMFSDPRAQAQIQQAVRNYVSSTKEDMESFEHSIQQAFAYETGLDIDEVEDIASYDALVPRLKELSAEYRSGYQEFNNYKNAYSDMVDELLRKEDKYTTSAPKIAQQIREEEALLRELQKRSASGWTTADKKKAEELQASIASAKKDYKTLTGKDWVSGSQAAKANQTFTDVQRNQEKARERDAVDLERQAAQARIDAMDEGSEKTLRQMDLNYQKELDSINRWYEDLRDEKIKKEKELYEANPAHKNGAFTYNYNDSKYGATPEEVEAMNLRLNAADEKYLQGVKKFYLDIYDTADTYSSKMRALNEKYENELMGLLTREAELREQLSGEITSREANRLAAELRLNLQAQATNRENRKRDVKKLYDEILSTSSDYETQSARITEQYDKEKRDLQKRHNELTVELMKAKTEEERKAAEEEIELNEKAQAQSDKNRENALRDLKEKYGDFYKRLAKDRSKFLLGETVQLLKDAKEELEKLGDEKLADDETLERIQRLRQEIEELKNEVSQTFTVSGILKALLQPGKEGTEHKGFGERLKSLIDAWREMSAEQKWQAIGSVVEKIGEGLGKAAEHMREIAELTGDKGLSQTADEMEALGQNFQSAGEGAAQGGWIGAIVGGASDMLSQTIEAFQNVSLQEAIAERNAKDWADAVELAAIAVKDADFSGPFGDKKIGYAMANARKATETIDIYRRKLKELNEEYSNQEIEQYEMRSKGATVFGMGLGGLVGLPGLEFLGLAKDKVSNEFKAYEDAIEKGYDGLQRMLIKTKDHTGWANFWGKQDEYTALGDIAPELWDENGEFNVEMAERFLDVNTQISDEQRRQIEQLVELKKSYDDAIAAIDDAISETFGNLSSDLTDIIWDSVMNGANAWNEFERVGSEAIANLGKQLINEMLISEYLEQYREQMREAYKAGNVQDTQSQLRNIIGDIFGGMEQMFNAGSVVAEEYKQWAETHGFDLTSRQTNADATTQSYQQISETTGSAIQGGVTALRISSEIRNEQLSLIGANISEMVQQQMKRITLAEDVRNILVDSYMAIIKIRDNTSGNLSAVQAIEDYVSRIEKNTRTL